MFNVNREMENSNDDLSKINLDKYKILNEIYTYELNESGEKEKVKIVYLESKLKYSENIKKAVAKYQENHREKINQSKKEKHKERYENDLEYREKIKERRRKYYAENKK